MCICFAHFYFKLYCILYNYSLYLCIRNVQQLGATNSHVELEVMLMTKREKALYAIISLLFILVFVLLFKQKTASNSSSMIQTLHEFSGCVQHSSIEHSFLLYEISLIYIHCNTFLTLRQLVVLYWYTDFFLL